MWRGVRPAREGGGGRARGLVPLRGCGPTWRLVDAARRHQQDQRPGLPGVLLERHQHDRQAWRPDGARRPGPVLLQREPELRRRPLRPRERAEQLHQALQHRDRSASPRLRDLGEHLLRTIRLHAADRMPAEHGAQAPSTDTATRRLQAAAAKLAPWLSRPSPRSRSSPCSWAGAGPAPRWALANHPLGAPTQGSARRLPVVGAEGPAPLPSSAATTRSLAAPSMGRRGVSRRPTARGRPLRGRRASSIAATCACASSPSTGCGPLPRAR
jgi:hypothetical protein